MSNNFDVVSARTPRVKAEIGGEIIDSVMYADMTAAGSCKSSHFELTVSTSVTTSGCQWLSLLGNTTTVKILACLRHSDNDTLVFEGVADNVVFDPFNNVAFIRGRDYSSTLINSTYQASYSNQTASEVANTVAQRHGFLPNIADTSTLIGSYQCDSYNQVLLNTHSRITSEWDLLTYLAKIENFELFVEGTTLVFAPLSALPQNYMEIDKHVARDIKFTKVCPLSDKRILTVKSWNSWLGKVSLYTDNQSSEVVASSDAGWSDSSGAEIAIIRPNLTPQDAQLLSQRCLNSLKEQDLSVEVTMPGEMTLKPGDVISVDGGGTHFDSDYIVRTVRRQFSPTAGFIQHIQGFAPGIQAALSPGAETF